MKKGMRKLVQCQRNGFDLAKGLGQFPPAQGIGNVLFFSLFAPLVRPVSSKPGEFLLYYISLIF
jgi:hypothetical protein